MDLIGIEPMTSSMPWKRAPNCATGPRDAGMQLFYSLRWGCDSSMRGTGRQCSRPETLAALSQHSTNFKEVHPCNAAVVKFWDNHLGIRSLRSLSPQDENSHPGSCGRTPPHRQGHGKRQPLFPAGRSRWWPASMASENVPTGPRLFWCRAKTVGNHGGEVCRPVSMCLPLPDDLSDLEAAAIANPGIRHGSR